MHVSGGLDSGPACEPRLNCPGRQAFTLPAHEQPPFFGACKSGARRHPRSKRLERMTPDRHDALLTAFTNHPNGAVAPIDRIDVERGQLGEAQPR